MITDFSNYKWRCSSLGHLTTSVVKITDNQLGVIADLQNKQLNKPLTAKQSETLKELIAKRDAPDELPKGALTHIDDVFREKYWMRKRILENKYLEKGNLCEQDALELISKVDGKFYPKNKESFENEFIQGTPDSVHDFVDDTKASWDLESFDKTKSIDHIYNWQVKAYCWLTGRTKGRVRHCLVNAPEHLVTEEIKRVYFRMGCPDETNDRYLDLARQIERNMIFDKAKFVAENPGYDFRNSIWDFDIPEKYRVKTFGVELLDSDIEIIKSRVKMARKVLQEKVNEYSNQQKK